MYKYEVTRDLGAADNDVTFCEVCDRKIHASKDVWRADKYTEDDRCINTVWICTRKCVNLYLLQADYDE